MKNSLLLATLLVLFALSACQTDHPYPPPTELSFATDPSVLRDNWSGTIQNVPAEQDVALSLINLVAECPDAVEGKCFSYTFAGKVSVGGSDFVPISGRGFAGNHLYVLTSPARPLGFDATFQLGGDTWQISADYLPYLYSTTPEAPLYQGYVYVEGSQRQGAFTLEPAR